MSVFSRRVAVSFARGAASTKINYSRGASIWNSLILPLPLPPSPPVLLPGTVRNARRNPDNDHPRWPRIINARLASFYIGLHIGFLRNERKLVVARLKAINKLRYCMLLYVWNGLILEKEKLDLPCCEYCCYIINYKDITRINYVSFF